MTFNRIISIVLMLMVAIVSGCKSFSEKAIDSRNEKFLHGFSEDEEMKETFRVLLMSDKYEVVQTNYHKHVSRKKDVGGDRFICDELKKFDIINDEREGMIKIWLFPDRGTIMKIRPQKLIAFQDILELIYVDIRRWDFQFYHGIYPLQMLIKYRVVLRKKQSDDQIIDRIQKRMSGED